MIELSGLWLNDSKEGKKYFSGSLGRARLLVFKNDFKKDEREPDYLLYLDKPVKKESAPEKQDSDMDIPF